MDQTALLKGASIYDLEPWISLIDDRKRGEEAFLKAFAKEEEKRPGSTKTPWHEKKLEEVRASDEKLAACIDEREELAVSAYWLNKQKRCVYSEEEMASLKRGVVPGVKSLKLDVLEAKPWPNDSDRDLKVKEFVLHWILYFFPSTDDEGKLLLWSGFRIPPLENQFEVVERQMEGPHGTATSVERTHVNKPCPGIVKELVRKTMDMEDLDESSATNKVLLGLLKRALTCLSFSREHWRLSRDGNVRVHSRDGSVKYWSTNFDHDNKAYRGKLDLFEWEAMLGYGLESWRACRNVRNHVNFYLFNEHRFVTCLDELDDAVLELSSELESQLRDFWGSFLDSFTSGYASRLDCARVVAFFYALEKRMEEEALNEGEEYRSGGYSWEDDMDRGEVLALFSALQVVITQDSRFLSYETHEKGKTTRKDSCDPRFLVRDIENSGRWLIKKALSELICMKTKGDVEKVHYCRPQDLVLTGSCDAWSTLSSSDTPTVLSCVSEVCKNEAVARMVLHEAWDVLNERLGVSAYYLPGYSGFNEGMGMENHVFVLPSACLDESKWAKILGENLDELILSVTSDEKSNKTRWYAAPGCIYAVINVLDRDLRLDFVFVGSSITDHVFCMEKFGDQIALEMHTGCYLISPFYLVQRSLGFEDCTLRSFSGGGVCSGGRHLLFPIENRVSKHPTNEAGGYSFIYSDPDSGEEVDIKDLERRLSSVTVCDYNTEACKRKTEPCINGNENDNGETTHVSKKALVFKNAFDQFGGLVKQSASLGEPINPILLDLIKCGLPQTIYMDYYGGVLSRDHFYTFSTVCASLIQEQIEVGPEVRMDAAFRTSLSIIKEAILISGEHGLYTNESDRREKVLFCTSASGALIVPENNKERGKHNPCLERIKFSHEGPLQEDVFTNHVFVLMDKDLEPRRSMEDEKVSFYYSTKETSLARFLREQAQQRSFSRSLRALETIGEVDDLGVLLFAPEQWFCYQSETGLGTESVSCSCAIAFTKGDGAFTIEFDPNPTFRKGVPPVEFGEFVGYEVHKIPCVQLELFLRLKEQLNPLELNFRGLENEDMKDVRVSTQFNTFSFSNYDGQIKQNCLPTAVFLDRIQFHQAGLLERQTFGSLVRKSQSDERSNVVTCNFLWARISQKD